jgi:alcohol dehydrogenase/propanol-preferring alcohol dehydrogenase
VPGHEVAGTIAKVGAGVTRWKVGENAGCGWHGNHCYNCNNCRKGAFVCCSQGQVTGIHRDGGYAEYCIIEQGALVPIPAGMAFEHAGPLMCAGVTVYNSLRNVQNAVAGDVVAVQGIGGLGHLGIQFANKMGFRVVAISTSDDKKALATELGAHDYINATTHNVATELGKLGGAKVILATATDAKSISPLVDGLGLDGTLVLLGADPAPINVSALQLIPKRASVKGWPSGSPVDTEEALKFAQLTGVKPRVEIFPLDKVNEAFERAMANKARFRVVLKP